MARGVGGAATPPQTGVPGCATPLIPRGVGGAATPPLRDAEACGGCLAASVPLISGEGEEEQERSSSWGHNAEEALEVPTEPGVSSKGRTRCAAFTLRAGLRDVSRAAASFAPAAPASARLFFAGGSQLSFFGD